MSTSITPTKLVPLSTVTEGTKPQNSVEARVQQAAKKSFSEKLYEAFLDMGSGGGGSPEMLMAQLNHNMAGLGSITVSQIG